MKIGSITFTSALLLLTLSLAPIGSKAAVLTNSDGFIYFLLGDGSGGTQVRISGYCGPGGDVTIPRTLDGFPVYRIQEGAFAGNPLFQKVTVPESVALDFWVFVGCTNLTSAVVGSPFVQEVDFAVCTGLSQVSLGDGVVEIDYRAFFGCISLTNMTIPRNVRGIGPEAFRNCSNLRSIFFKGNAPIIGSLAFDGDTNATVYYLPGKSGWGPTLGGRPAVMLSPSQMLEQLVLKVDESEVANRRSLTVSLLAALASIERGNPIAAVNQLQAFQKKVSTQIARSDPALAQTLIKEAQDIIGAITE